MPDAALAQRALTTAAPRLAAARPRVRLGALFLAGAVTALGQAPFDLPLATLLGLAAGLAILARIPGTRAAFWSGWVFAFGQFLTAWTWLVEPFLVDPVRYGWMAPFGITFVAGAAALYWALAAAVASRVRPGGLRLIALVLAIVAAEYLRGVLFTGFPWGMVAYAWIDTPIAQLLAWIGPHGLNLVTLAVAAVWAWWLAMRRGGAAVLATLALGAVAILALRPGPPPEADTGAPVIRMVQPNAPQDEKWLPGNVEMYLERHIAFTGAGEVAPDLVVWSEGAMPYVLENAGPVLDRTAAAARGATVLMGAMRWSGGGYLSTLAMVDGQGDVAATYDKVHLVPYGEYLPFEGAMRWLGLSELAVNPGGGFVPGDRRDLIDVPGVGPILPLICYEGIFPAEVADMPARPRLIVLITNDAWFGRFSGPYQHLAQGRARAIEQGLPLVRVAQTGVSAMIDGKGRVTAAIPLGEAGWRDAALPRALPPTRYSRTGDLPIVVLVTVAAIALGAVAVLRPVDRPSA